jgi:hypothetical protein
VLAFSFLFSCFVRYTFSPICLYPTLYPRFRFPELFLFARFSLHSTSFAFFARSYHVSRLHLPGDIEHEPARETVPTNHRNQQWSSIRSLLAFLSASFRNDDDQRKQPPPCLRVIQVAPILLLQSTPHPFLGSLPPTRQACASSSAKTGPSSPRVFRPIRQVPRLAFLSHIVK